MIGVGKRVRLKDPGGFYVGGQKVSTMYNPILIVTEMTNRGFKYVFEEPQPPLCPRLGLGPFLGGETYVPDHYEEVSDEDINGDYHKDRMKHADDLDWYEETSYGQ